MQCDAAFRSDVSEQLPGASRCRGDGMHNPMCFAHPGEDGAGVVDTRSIQPEGVRLITAGTTANAAGEW